MYTGALAEHPVNGGLLGPTFTCLIADQFFRLKIGDRFWYETNEKPQRFTLGNNISAFTFKVFKLCLKKNLSNINLFSGQLNEIRKTTLGKIICKTSEVNQTQIYVMRKIGTGNELKNCSDFSYPDLSLWRNVG